VIEIVRAQQKEDAITIRLPVHWPVATLNIIRRDTQELVWQVAHESFHQVNVRSEGIRLRIDRLVMEPLSIEHNERVTDRDEYADLTYGVAPKGMKQFFPDGVPPTALRSGIGYIIAIRDSPSSEIRRFYIELS